MERSRITLRRKLLGAAAAIGVLAASSIPAFAAQGGGPDPADTEALRQQVLELTALVKSLAERDQAEIQALSAQVKTLQAQLAQAPVATQSAPQGALPRAGQNATGQFAIQGAPPPPPSNKAEPRVVQNASNRFAFESADGQYSIGFTGDIQFDSGAYVGFHPASALVGPQALSNGENARRARIGVTGTAFGDWSYAFVYDAGNSQDTTPKGIQTAQIVFGGLQGAAFEIGYSNTFFTLDQSTSSNDILFLERASPSNIATNFNAGDARANLGARFFGDRYWAGAYFTGPASGDSHTLTQERFGAFQRVAVQALSGPGYSLHLGVDVDELLQAPNSGAGAASAISLSDQPQLRIDPTTLLNTGAVGTLTNPVTGGYVLDLETAATFHSLFWQGEYYHYDISRQGLPRAEFEGGYGELSWTLTGETHPYNPQAGAYYRISPRRPFSLSQGGWGAWEVAARFSTVDLNSNFVSGTALSADPAAIDGGRQSAYDLGLNWYPNDFVRLMFDLSHVDFDKANGVVIKGVPLGAPVGAKFDALSMRVQVAY